VLRSWVVSLSQSSVGRGHRTAAAPEPARRMFRQALLAFLPLMVGYFALNVPSGLSLYYFANTVITSGQQIWLRKLGGARAHLGVSWVAPYPVSAWLNAAPGLPCPAAWSPLLPARWSRRPALAAPADHQDRMYG